MAGLIFGAAIAAMVFLILFGPGALVLLVARRK